MSHQLTRQSIDIDPSKRVEFLAINTEDVAALHHRNVGAFAVEDIAVHE
jgi:hypothetical protein